MREPTVFTRISRHAWHTASVDLSCGKAEANYLENHGIYGFKEMALRHGCKSLRDLHVYGGQLAGDIDAFDARELATA